MVTLRSLSLSRDLDELPSEYFENRSLKYLGALWLIVSYTSANLNVYPF